MNCLDQETGVAVVSPGAELGGAEMALSCILAQGALRHSVVFTTPEQMAVTQLNASKTIQLDVEYIFDSTPTRSRSLKSRIKQAFSIPLDACKLKSSPKFQASGIVYANSFRASIIGGLATFKNQKLVIHVRDNFSGDAMHWCKRAIFLRFAFPRCSALIFNSQLTADEFHSSSARKIKSTVIQSPIGFTERLSPDQNMGIRRFRSGNLVYVARLDPQKGQDAVLRAFANHANCFSGASLTFVGGAAFGQGAYESQLRRTVKDLNLESQVSFLGHVSRTEVSRILRHAKFGIHASRTPEPLGQNVLQYLANGLPVLVPDRGGFQPLVRDEDNGLVFELNNEEHLDEIIKDALSISQSDYLKLVSNVSDEGILTDAEVAESIEGFLRDVWREN